MNAAQKYDKLSLLKLAFPSVADNELQQIAGLTEICSYPPDHTLCREGALENDFYIFAEGEAVITKKISSKEGERVLRIATKGDLIGEMGLIQSTTRSATVRTTKETTVLKMNKNNFDTMINSSPSVALSIIRTTLNRMRENDQNAIDHLQNTNKILRQLDRNKEEFIQVAAHELRTPLTVIKGYVELLRSLSNQDENSRLKEVMEGIIKGTERLHKIVNTMLDVTRLDNETLDLHATPVPLKGLILDTLREFNTAATERKIKLETDIAKNPFTINADPELLQKAIYHLIVNAIKYTPDGGKIKVSTRPIEMDDGRPGVEIAVKDNGIGLDPEHHELIFEKFYQVGSVAIHSSGNTTYKGGGSGLGLAIVRGVAIAHRGKAWVESRGYSETDFPGCAFYLQLPEDPES